MVVVAVAGLVLLVGMLEDLAVICEFLGDLGNQPDICTVAYSSFYESFLHRSPGFRKQCHHKA